MHQNDDSSISRRTFLGGMAGAAFAGSFLGSPAEGAVKIASSFADILRKPDSVAVTTETETVELTTVNGQIWEKNGIAVITRTGPNGLTLQLESPTAPIKQVQFTWSGGLPNTKRFLADHWERAYGDLGWAEPNPDRPMPWYFMAYDGQTTHGYGMMTGPSAWCYWKASPETISLFADVRSGGVGVQLSKRTLTIGTVISRRGSPSESPVQAVRTFCGKMCPKPRLLNRPIFGTNDWYYSYGAGNCAEEIIKDAQFIASLAPSGPVRPYTVIDAGWHVTGGCEAGPWSSGNARFPSMSGLARDIVKAGAVPGIWIRPLAAAADSPKAWRLSRNEKALDPTVPEVRQLVATDIGRLRTWGYELIKHDFTTFDLTGRWGMDMGSTITDEGWTFADRSQTTVEVIANLYRTIREAAGDAALMGCNTLSHLSAGLFEINRIGDDTSGKEWARTRKMGVNALAFRHPQHRAFYAADADCLGLTSENTIPWEMNRQWLDLLARSGTPLFISVNRSTVGPEQEKAFREALAIAAVQQPLPEPLDWMETPTPERWKLMGQEVRYHWA